MPYLVVNTDRQETEHREIGGDCVIGRAVDCEISVRDILLSRRHCKVQRSPKGWLVVDLGSKNGTIINNERVTEPKVLHENDVLRVGRSKMIFHEGKLAPELASRPRPQRAVDPGDSLSGTLSGFTLLMPGEGETSSTFAASTNAPCPQPRPKDPAAYQRDDVESLLSAIASSSWDSIYAEARSHKPSSPKAAGDDTAPKRRRPRPRSPIDLSLQVSSSGSSPDSEPQAVAAAAKPATNPDIPSPASRGMLKSAHVFSDAAISRPTTPDPEIELELEPEMLIEKLLPIEAQLPVEIAGSAANEDVAQPRMTPEMPAAAALTPRGRGKHLQLRRWHDLPVGPGRILTYMIAAVLLGGALLFIINGTPAMSSGSTSDDNSSLPAVPAQSSGHKTIPGGAFAAPGSNVPAKDAPAMQLNAAFTISPPTNSTRAGVNQRLSIPDPQAIRLAAKEVALRMAWMFW